ncbi:MAG TPA: thioredoxin family protein [Alphaproteobacteria bacterium]|nr:thioredoxin family protein [Alphaproteobacteria bacterium]
MADRRKIEIFSAGCTVCEAAVERVKALACPSCDINVLDMTDAGIAARAENFGIRSLPAVVINGTLADCCSGRGIDEDALRSAGLGQPIV